MSVREAMLRRLQNSSLAGDMDAAAELQNLRDTNKVDGQPVNGCLLLPDQISLEEWERLAAEQQAPFREKDYGKEASS